MFTAPFRKRKAEKETAANQQAVGAGAGVAGSGVAGSGIAGAEQNFGGEQNLGGENFSGQNYGQSYGQEYSDDQDFSTPNFDSGAGNNSTADGVDANAETTQWSTDNQWDNGKK